MIPPAGPFTGRLWKECRDTVERIADAPFYRAMAEGGLSRDSFRSYLEQDALYLAEDSRALKMTAEACVIPAEKAFFEKLATQGMDLERDLHRRLGEEFSLEVKPAEMSPACRCYSAHLLEAAERGSCRESATALLPCYWVYQNAGLKVRERSTGANPYGEWLETYGGEEFASYTREFIALIESMSAKAGEAERERMAGLFAKSADLELAFISSFPA